MTEMAEEYFRPDEMVSQSIAEMNLTEEMSGILDIITKESVRITELMNALCDGKVELVRKGYEYVRSLKEDAQLKKEKTMEYLVRVAPTLLNKEVYMFALYHIDFLSQQLDEFAFKLSLAAQELVKAERGVCEEGLRMVYKIREIVEALLLSSKSLNINRTRALEAANTVILGESEVDSIYRSLEQKLMGLSSGHHGSCLAYCLAREVFALAEQVADVARDIAYDIKYLILYRK